MRTITTPDWLKKLPGDAYINSREIVKLFGYSEKTRPYVMYGCAGAESEGV